MLILVHAVPIAGAVLWLVPRTRKKALRFVLPGFAGLLFSLTAVWNQEVIWRWDVMFQRWLTSIGPRPYIVFTSKLMFPTVYFLGAWVLGFVLALQVVLWRENKRKQEPLAVSD
jgi:hypothetical protein